MVYIGVLGSHAALLLSVPRSGTGLLTAAILVTVAYDVGGLVVGRAAGRTPLSPASPNKTVEGLVGGCRISPRLHYSGTILAPPVAKRNMTRGELASMLAAKVKAQ